MWRSTPAALLLSLLVLVPATLQAQNWTAEQQEVITQLEECWDVWIEAVNEGRPDAWLDRCTDDFLYWNQTGAPTDAERLRREWGDVMAFEERWVELRPLVVRIIDDVAIMHFYGSWNLKQGEERVTQERKRTEVFRNVNGRWLLIAGHGQPSGN